MAFFALLAALPYLLPELSPALKQNRVLLSKWLGVLITANLLAIVAMSWDLLGGYAGQISFGHSFFFGLGAFTAAILSLTAGWNPWVVIVVGAVVAAFAVDRGRAEADIAGFVEDLVRAGMLVATAADSEGAP